MLFTEAELSYNPLSILDEATYLTEDEYKLYDVEVPIIKCKRLNTNLIDKRYITEGFSTSIEYTPVIDEVDVILGESSEGCIVRPLSKMDKEYLFCEEVCNEWLLQELNYSIQDALGGSAPILKKPDKNGIMRVADRQKTDQAMGIIKHILKNKGISVNDNFLYSNKDKVSKALDSLGNVRNFSDEMIAHLAGVPIGNFTPKRLAPDNSLKGMVGRAWDNNKRRLGVGTAVALGAAGLYKMISHHLEKQPKTVIGKRIAALRGIYKNWLDKANNTHDYKISTVFKKAAATLLNVIDMLLKKLYVAAEKDTK